MYLLLCNEKKCSKNDCTNHCTIYPVFGERSNTAKIQYLLAKDDIIVFHKENELKNTQSTILNSTSLIICPSTYSKVSLQSRNFAYNHKNLKFADLSNTHQ